MYVCNVCNVCMYVCMCVCMYVCVFVCMYLCIWTYKLYIFLCVDPTWSSTLRGLRSLRSLVPSGDVPSRCAQATRLEQNHPRPLPNQCPTGSFNGRNEGHHFFHLISTWFNMHFWSNVYIYNIIIYIYVYSHISGFYGIWLYRCLFLYWYASMSTRILVIKHVMYRHVCVCVSINYKPISMQYISTCVLYIYMYT
jgi:hypothetical protein